MSAEAIIGKLAAIAVVLAMTWFLGQALHLNLAVTFATMWAIAEMRRP